MALLFASLLESASSPAAGGAREARLRAVSATLGVALAAALGAAPSIGCTARPACNGVGCAPACPLGADRDPSGRCACSGGDALVLGACVSLAVADAYCGPAARFTRDGCAFRACAAGQRLDPASGACVAPALLAEEAASCPDGGVVVPTTRHVLCFSAAGAGAGGNLEATCPRGTRRIEDGDAGGRSASCVRPLRCPAGSLTAGASCMPVVTAGERDGLPRVDVGAWTSLALGADGGPGSADLCRPLWMRPDLFQAAGRGPGAVRLRITITVPDQDMTRVHTTTLAELETDEGPRPMSGEAAALASASVDTLVEALRALGGESSTAVLQIGVRCAHGEGYGAEEPSTPRDGEP